MSRLWIILFCTFIVYTGFVYYNCDKKTDNTNTPSEHALAGWKTWQDKNCQSCHQVYGLGGYLGPDLTNIASNPVKNEIYIRTFIKYGNGRMPNLNLDDTEINDLVAFLQWVDKSGKSRVSEDKVTWTGNYNIEN
jgi:nitric oxide reductase subunit C